ncbi:MAG: Penicillin-binding protein, 1A family, partial [Microgenomates group bacterium GW2011_GWC1_39_7]
MQPKKNSIIKTLKLSKKKILVFIFFVAALVASFLFVLKDIPESATIGANNYPQSTKIYDRNGKMLYTFYTTKNQTFVSLDKISENLKKATIAIEDRDFYKHGAIDLRGITRAFIYTVFKKQVQGGSTITQQLVKNSLLTPERTITRKIKEIILAFVVEGVYSKDKILEMYLNQVSYGGTAWGVEAASYVYFDKPVERLNLAESAFLAALPEAPSIYSPFGSRPELGKKRQLEVLRRMEEQKYITKDQRREAGEFQLKFSKIQNKISAPHFVFYVKALLVQKYGARAVEQGGLNVTTSLDLDLQNYAQASVAAEISTLERMNVTNGAALIAKPGTGEILAMVGSKDYFDEENDGNVNVVLAKRQPGSSIKPINYAVGLIKGFTAATPFVDEKTCFPNPGRAPYCPLNYDGKFHGVVQMRFALANSFNIPAVKMLKANGLEAMMATASAMGIKTFEDL